jgi:hypothetical protein
MNSMTTQATGDADQGTAATGRKRLLVAGGVAAGLAAVAGVAFVLLTGGTDPAPDGAASPDVKAVATRLPATDAPTGPATGAPTASGAIKTYSGKSAKDPFAPLVVEPVSGDASAGTAAAGTAAAGTAPDGTAPATGQTTGSGASRPTKAQTVKMLSVTGSSASLSVDSVKHKARIGQTFGTYYKLLSLSSTDPCGLVQYGDVTVELCEGKSVKLF